MIKIKLLNETLQGDIDRHTDAKSMLNNIIGIIKHVGDEIPVLESINYDSYPNLDIYAVMDKDSRYDFSLFIRLIRPEIFYLQIDFIEGTDKASAESAPQEITVAGNKQKLCNIDIGYHYRFGMEHDSLDIFLLKIIKQTRESFIHELTHILDIHFTKLKNFKLNKIYSQSTHPKQYFEDGLELNARWAEFLENLNLFLYTNYDKSQDAYYKFFNAANRSLHITELTAKKQQKIEKKLKELFFNGPYPIPRHIAHQLADDLDTQEYWNQSEEYAKYEKLTKENQKIVKTILYHMGAPGFDYDDIE